MTQQISASNAQLDSLCECLFDDKKIIAEIKTKVMNKEIAPRTWRFLPRSYFAALIKKAVHKSQAIRTRFAEIIEQLNEK